MTKCPYYEECGVVNNCDMYEQCIVKEWIDDFYKVEKLYQDSEKKYNAASFIANNLKKKCEKLMLENEKLKNERTIDLRNQLEQLKAENEKLKQDIQEETKLGHKAMCDEADRFFEVMKLQKVLDEIERLTKMHIQECIDNDDCYRAREQMKIILQLIKQAKEVKE